MTQGEPSRFDEDIRLFSQAGFSQFSWLPGGASQAPLTQASEAAGSSQKFGPPAGLPAVSSEVEVHDGSDDDDDDDPLGLKTLNVFAAVRRAMDGLPHY